jgi:hypothetical protein
LFHDRRLLILQDQYKQKTEEYNTMKAKIMELIPSKKEEHEREVQRLHWIHVLANEKVRLNDTIGDNNELKTKIDVMR